MTKYELYYICPENRVECMVICALNNKINWCEDGLRILSWEFKYIYSGEAESLNSIFKKHSKIIIDKRRKENIRSINIGDVILLDNTPWIISSFGFIRIPDILFEKLKLKA